MFDCEIVPATATPTRPLAVTALCLECGSPFERRKRTAEFCAPSCRKVWNNRRMTRGAEVYDLFMALRYEREAATEAGVWKLLCRMAQEHHNEDAANRGGRRSYQKPQTVLDRNVHLQATALKQGKRK